VSSRLYVGMDGGCLTWWEKSQESVEEEPGEIGAARRGWADAAKVRGWSEGEGEASG